MGLKMRAWWVQWWAHLATGCIYSHQTWEMNLWQITAWGKKILSGKTQHWSWRGFFLSLPFPEELEEMPWFAEHREVAMVFGELNEQRAANPPPSPHLSAEDPLRVLSGADLSEKWWGNNPLKVILLKISLQKLSSPGLTEGTRASGAFSLSYGTGEESKACAVLGVQILCWVTPVLFRELDKSWGLCIWISACLQSEL